MPNVVDYLTKQSQKYFPMQTNEPALMCKISLQMKQ